MRDTTTIRISVATREALRALADDDGLTADEELGRLLRAERQRRMGLALAADDPSNADRAWIDAGVEVAGRDAFG